MIRRFEPGNACGGEYEHCHMETDDDGEYVLYPDYQKLQVLCKQLAEACKKALPICEQANYAASDTKFTPTQRAHAVIGLEEALAAYEKEQSR